jgi:hypothetical protein
MITRVQNRFHALVALGIFVCALCPFLEMTSRCEGSIFQTGRDTESTIAILLLLFELAFAIARMFSALFIEVLQTSILIGPSPDLRWPTMLNFGAVPPEMSPPLSLRI